MSVSGSGVSAGGSANTDWQVLVHGGPAFEDRLARFREAAAIELEAKARHGEAVALKTEAEALLADAKQQAADNRAEAERLRIALEAAENERAKFAEKYEALLTAAR